MRKEKSGNDYYKTYIPNEIVPNSTILFVGDFPGEDDEDGGRPFLGRDGQLLFSTLANFGYSRSTVSLAYVCNYRPYYNQSNTPALEEGILTLMQMLEANKFNVIVPLGKEAFEAVANILGDDNPQSLNRVRGSILDINGQKVIATFHPSFILRVPSAYPTFYLDLQRVAEEAKSPEIQRSKRDYYIVEDALQASEWCDKLCAASKLAVDIETIRDSNKILCIGFATSPQEAVVFPYTPEYRQAIETILAYNNTKIFHFGIFDTLVLRSNGLIVQGYTEDTHIAQHIIEPELERSLEYLTSIYTKEPPYKKAGRGEIPNDTKVWTEKMDKSALYIYNAKDCVNTFEIHEKQLAELQSNKDKYDMYCYEIEMLEVATHISESGLPIDLERRELFKNALVANYNRYQAILNLLAQKRINVKSPKDVPNLLYNTLGLPTKKNKKGSVTTDEDAIIACITHCVNERERVKKPELKEKWERARVICKLILLIRGFRTLLSTYILATISSDMRVRSMYKISATETGRWAADSFVDGTGFNAQTVPRGRIEIPDKLDPQEVLQDLLDELAGEKGEEE